MEQNHNITPEQAFNIIANATGNLKLNRQDHQLITQSLQVLAGLLPTKEEK